MRSSKEFQQGVTWSDLQFEELIWFAVRRTQYIKRTVQNRQTITGAREENLGWEMMVVMRYYFERYLRFKYFGLM